jgi:type I restriction enzyme, S subunit
MDTSLTAKRASGSDDEPWVLPEGWAWVALREVGNWTSGGTPKSTEPGYYDGPIAWFRITDLNGGRLKKSEKSLTIRGLEESSAKIIDAPFLMFAMYGASIGKMAISEIDASTNQAIACCAPSEAADIDFIFLALQLLKTSIVALGQGGAQPNISQRILLDCRIPLAPLSEQRRIVERVNTLLAEIAEGEVALEDARKGLEIFRRALLKSAVTGELTRDWRETNKPNETGHDLLARIKAERDATSAKERSKRAAASPPLDTSDLPELPEGWAWATLEDVKAGNQRNGISIAGSSSPPGVKAMRLDALTASGLNLDAVRYIPLNEDRIEDYKVNRGDFLVSRANGSAELVGRAVLVEEVNEVVVFPDTMIRYPLGKDQRVGRWIEAAWSSPFGRSQIRRLAKTTAGILKISQEDIAQIFLPMPPLAEVDEILRRVTAALIINTDTMEFLKDRAADATRLRQAILKSAFEGTLVQQDPSDEPASALLERLEDTQIKKHKQTKRRKRV